MPEPASRSNTARKWRAWAAVLTGVVLLGAALAIWGGRGRVAKVAPRATLDAPREEFRRPLPPPEGFLGSSVCHECHAEIARSYAQHPMSRSLAPVLDVSEPAEAGVAHFTRGGKTYTVRQADDGVYHHEAFIDNQGVLYDQAVEVHLAVGSGRRGRSFFIDRGGLMFMSPISWYASDRRWDLSPSFRERGHMRFARPVTGRCLSCHAGRVNYEPGQNDRFRHPPVAEFAIGCERCHGPGRGHVAYRRAETASGSDPIVNPARLDPARRDAVCNQCHLQGDHEVLRYGRGDFDFRPGMNLGEIWTIFVQGTGVHGGGTMAVSQVQQMHASRCYRESQGRLGCISCHDPHGVPEEEVRAGFFNARCQACHDQRGCSLPRDRRDAPPASGSCIHCHMPRLNAADVPHTTQTDHRIPRFAGHAGSEAAPGAARPAEQPGVVFDAGDVALSEAELSRATGIYLAARAELGRDKALADRARRILEPVYRAIPGDSFVVDALALVSALAGDEARALDIWKRGLLADPNHEGILFSLASLHWNRGEHAEAIRYLDRLVTVNPWRGEYFGLRARVLLALGRAQQAIESAEHAASLDPSVPMVYEWLAYAYEQIGDGPRAARFRSLEKRIKQ